MSAEPIQDNFASSRYGALVIITQLLHAQIETLITSLQHNDMRVLAIYAKLADDMLTAIGRLTPVPEAADAQRQLEALLRQHRAFIVSPAPFTDNPVRNAALAEIQEMDAISVAAIDRLGRRLGIFSD